MKVLFLGRHGQGWHNVAEAKYGTHAWDVRVSPFSSPDLLSLPTYWPLTLFTVPIAIAIPRPHPISQTKLTPQLTTPLPQTVLLLRPPLPRQPHLLRRPPHPPRRLPSPRRLRPLGRPNPRANPRPRNILRLPANPHAANRRPDILFSASAQGDPVQPARQGTPA